MRADDVIDTTRQGTIRVLSLIEEAQAQAASLVQQWNKLGGAAAIASFDFTGYDLTSAEIGDAINSLGTAFPDILGAHGTNLYKLKRG